MNHTHRCTHGLAVLACARDRRIPQQLDRCADCEIGDQSCNEPRCHQAHQNVACHAEPTDDEEEAPIQEEDGKLYKSDGDQPENIGGDEKLATLSA